MHVIYTPEDGDRQEWEFNPGRVRAGEGKELLQQYGENSWEYFVQGVRQNDLHARRVLLWHLIRRDHNRLKFADTPDFYTDELEVEFSSAEVAALREKLVGSPVAPDRKAQALAVFDAEMEQALAREAVAGKASTPTSTTESTTTG